jgi:mannose-6-phosphate isomerase-like protein (cupin superfamily)
MKGSQLIKKGASEYQRNIAGKKYKFLIKTEQLAGEEIKIVMQGEVEYSVGKKVYHLKEGDVLWHESTIPHKIKNSSDKKAVVFTVDTPPTFT